MHSAAMSIRDDETNTFDAIALTQRDTNNSDAYSDTRDTPHAPRFTTLHPLDAVSRESLRFLAIDI